MHKKLNLPKKNCVQCGLEFLWRKKWSRDWEKVKYCSEKCKRTGAAKLNVAYVLMALIAPSLWAESLSELDFLELQTQIATREIREDIPPHKHFFNSAVFLLEGRVILKLDDKTYLKQAGDSWIEPKEVLHSGVIDKSFSKCVKIFAVYHHLKDQPISYNN